MFGSMKSGVNAYVKVGVETGVMAASPHKLIVMLFEGTEVALHHALQQMKASDTAAKGQSITKAIRIIGEGLRASLDKNAGGEIAANLDALYAYMVQRLVQGNMNNDLAMVEEVLRLVGELKRAWEAIAPTAANTEPASASPYDHPAQRASALASA